MPGGQRMKFRGEERVVVLRQGKRWYAPQSYKLLMRELKGIEKRDRGYHPCFGMISPSFIERGYSIDDISFQEGTRRYSIDDYSRKNNIPFRKYLEERMEYTKSYMAKKRKEQEEEAKKPKSAMAELFG
jgi:hypothetical protein